MTEEKLNIAFTPIKEEVFIFGDKQISVRPYFTIDDKIAITQEYINNLNGGYPIHFSDEWARTYYIAEYGLILQILEFLTNIEIKDLDIDLVLKSGLWKEIISRISGYDELRESINKILIFQQNREALEKSVGNVVDSVSKKIITLINQLSELDAQSLKKVSEEFTESLKTLNQQVPGILKQ